jgi:DNA polymerase-3 subunit delta'
MIIWLAEKMHETCANKLLKLIEEPPENTIFILISEQPDIILPTIISRTQMIHVPVIEEEAIAKVVGNKIAHIANGNYVKALEISKEEYSNTENLENYRTLMLCAYSKDLLTLKNWIESMASRSREYIKDFLSYTQFITRECFIAHLQNSSLNYMIASEQAFSDKFKRFLTVDNIENIIELFDKANRDISQNVNTKIVLFDLGINLMTQIKK